MSRLPEQIIYNASGDAIPVTEKPRVDMGGSLGYIGDEHIAITAEQPEVGKAIILLHELIHLAYQSAVGEGCIKEPPDEAAVEYLAGGLLPLLVLNDYWKRFTPEEVVAFYHDKSRELGRTGPGRLLTP